MCWQVVLFEAAPEGAPVPGDELYQISLAHIVEAMQTFSPARITAADKMLTFLASQPRYAAVTLHLNAAKGLKCNCCCKPFPSPVAQLEVPHNAIVEPHAAPCNVAVLLQKRINVNTTCAAAVGQAGRRP